MLQRFKLTAESAMFTVLLLLNSAVYGAGVDAKTAVQCTTPSQCAYFDSVYAATPQFRSALQNSFKSANIKKPSWVGRGVSGPLIPVQLQGVTYLIGSVGQPHNAPNHVLVLYAPASGAFSAVYYPDDGRTIWLGQPSAAARKLLIDFEEGDTVSKALNSHDVKLPVRAD